MRRTMIIAMTAIVIAAIAGITLILTHSADNYGEPRPEPPVLHSTTLIGDDMTVEVDCEFDPPLKHITLIMNWYDSYDELNFDYQTLVDQSDAPEEVWGWSTCIWQPDDNWAACDIYVVLPEFVHGDMNVDTLGHEVLHGACGAYHPEEVSE